MYFFSQSSGKTNSAILALKKKKEKNKKNNQNEQVSLSKKPNNFEYGS
jgi:hypothetical protein